MNKDWFWTEASDEEFEENRKTLTYYKIFVISPDIGEIVLYKFWAKDNDDAYKTLQEFKNDFSLPEEVEGPFYSESGYYVSHTGKRYDTMMEMMKGEESDFFNNILDFFIYTIPEKLHSFVTFVSRIFYLLRTGRKREESWDIIYHMLDLLKHNLPIMIENLNSVPVNFENNPPEHFVLIGENTNTEYNDKLLCWKRELETLKYNVLAYLYYSDFGVIDKNDKQMKYIEEKLKDTIPYKSGTNKKIDYSKFNDLIQKHWNAIWDWIKQYGMNLWD